MNNINKYEEKVFSQNGEDGVVLYLIEIIAKKYDLDKSYFEFGVEDGSECITRIIREKLDWKGIILDGGNENKKINLFQRFITYNNIDQLIDEFKVPKNLGLLSIDTDYNDAYIATKLLKKITPSIIVAEYNVLYKLEDKTVIHDINYYWDRSVYYGASAKCLISVYKDYICVYMNNVNMIFVHKKIMKLFPEFKKLQLEKLINKFKIPAKFKKDFYGRFYASSKDLNLKFINITLEISEQLPNIIDKKDIDTLINNKKNNDYRSYDNHIKLIYAKTISLLTKYNKNIVQTLTSNYIIMKTR